MPEISNVAAFNGLYKIVYGDKLEKFLPENLVFTKLVPFESAKQLDDKFQFPILTSTEQGFSYGSDYEDGASDLEAAISMETKPVSVDGSFIALNGRIGYLAAQKARNSKAAFEDATKLKLTGLMASLRRRVEISALYGRCGIGKVASAAARTGTGPYRTALTITAGSHAPLIWAAALKAKVTFVKAADSAALPLAASGGTPGTSFQVVAVNTNSATRTVKIARELTVMIRGSATIDWTKKESMRRDVRRLLKKYKYPRTRPRRPSTRSSGRRS